MLKSIELLKKAEKLALMYDSEDGFWLGFSGGKDSQALIHIAQLADVKFKARFSPTSVDPPELIRFIRRQYPEVEFLPLKKSIYQEFLERKCLPSQKIRWCCAVYKENKAPNKVTLVGVRHAESARRAKRKSVEVSNYKFSGDIDEFKDWSQKTKAKKIQAAKNKAKRLHQLDQWSEHKEQMINCINGKDQIIISPIIEWTDEDVWTFLNDVVQVPHCELYDEGYHRIGCICCPMASIKNTLRDIERYPYVKENWIKAIGEIRKQSLENQQLTPPQAAFYKLSERWLPLPATETTARVGENGTRHDTCRRKAGFQMALVTIARLLTPNMTAQEKK
jgi:phosphoadenosine phosphosulfate reductase